jgi:hypothetical protein
MTYQSTGPVTVSVTIADQVYPLAQVTSIAQAAGAEGTTIALMLPLTSYRQGASDAVAAAAPPDLMGKALVVTVRGPDGVLEVFRATITRVREVYRSGVRSLDVLAMDGGGQAQTSYLHQWPYRNDQQIFYCAPGILNPSLRGNMSDGNASWGGGSSKGIQPRSGTYWTAYEALNAVQKSAYSNGVNWRQVDGSGPTTIGQWDLRGRTAGEVVASILDACPDVVWWWEQSTVGGQPTTALVWRPRLSPGSDPVTTLDLREPWVQDYTLDERGAQTAKEVRTLGQPTVWVKTFKHDPLNPTDTSFGTTDLIGVWDADDLERTEAGDPTSPAKRRFSVDWGVDLPETGDAGGGTIKAGFGTLLPDLPLVRDVGSTVKPGSAPIMIAVKDAAGTLTCVNGQVGAYIDAEGYLWITGDGWIDIYNNAAGIVITLAILSPRAVQVQHSATHTAGASVCVWSNLESIRCAGNVTLGVDEDGSPVTVTGDAIDATQSLHDLATEAWEVYGEDDTRLEWSTVAWSTIQVGDWIGDVTLPIDADQDRTVTLGRRVLSRSITWDGQRFTMAYMAGARR